MRRIVIVLALVLVAGVLTAPSAQASVDKLFSWRNCEQKTSGYGHKIKFARIPQTYGDGTYYIKSKITWQVLIGSDRWREYDHNVRESEHFFIDNPNFEFTLKHGDKTTWQNTYGRFWRVKTMVKLMKERTGPDAAQEKDERFFTKNVFREVGSNCELTRGQLSGP